MNTETVPLTGWRNGPFPEEPFIFESNPGVPVNLTGKTAAMDVRRTWGEGEALISLDMALVAGVDGIRFTDAIGGTLVIQIDQASMQAAWDAEYAAGRMKAGDPARLVYDLLLYDGDGVAEAWMEGPFTIQPGVTL